MTCRRIGDAIVCTPTVKEWSVIVRECIQCRRKRRMLQEITEWYGPTWTCLTCGGEYVLDSDAKGSFMRLTMRVRTRDNSFAIAAARARLAGYRKQKRKEGRSCGI